MLRAQIVELEIAQRNRESAPDRNEFARLREENYRLNLLLEESRKKLARHTVQVPPIHSIGHTFARTCTRERLLVNSRFTCYLTACLVRLPTPFACAVLACVCRHLCT